MPSTVQLKRSSVPGKVPTTAQLELAELAVNTRDGKLYLKRDNGNGTFAIIEIGAVLSVAGKTGAVTLAKGDVGLGNVDNTSDADKPISSAVQTALNGKQNVDADLGALAAIAANGILARTGSGAAAARTITPSGQVTVANGDGVAGNPTIGVTVASQAESQAGSGTGLMTAELTAQAIASQTNNVLAATAQAQAGAVGTYAVLRQTTTYTSRGVGTTVAGSSLRFTDSYGSATSGAIPAGTWRLMGEIGSSPYSYFNTAIWLRIA